MRTTTGTNLDLALDLDLNLDLNTDHNQDHDPDLLWPDVSVRGRLFK